MEDMTEEQCEEVWRQGVAQTSVRCLLPAGHIGPHEFPFAWPPNRRKR
jgi:hypothetical protein